MYQALLTRRYLTSKLMPLLAALAVLLCTAMVLVVWSVMGGFLNMLLASGKMMVGDVEVAYPVLGIPHYEEYIARLEADPLIEAATPTVEAAALIALPDRGSRVVRVVGVDGPGFDRVTGFGETLYWRRLAKPLKHDRDAEDPRLVFPAEPDLYATEGLTLTEPDPATGEPTGALVLGIEVAGQNERQPGGWYKPEDTQRDWGRLGYAVEGYADGAWTISRPAYDDEDRVIPGERERLTLSRLPFLFDDVATLSVLPVSRRGVAIDVQAQQLPIANEFRTGLFDADANIVLVRLDVLQKMLRLGRAVRVEESVQGGATVNERGEEAFPEPRVVGVVPARATNVLLRGAPGTSAEEVKRAAQRIYAEFAMASDDAPNPASVDFYTWTERPSVATLFAAVKKETALVLVLFAFISLTAVFLVFAIFWAMVSEKTKDIGVLRAVGASRSGVAAIFVSYGLAIGVVGALAGGLLAHMIVWNINPIHEWLGRTMGVVVWDPRVYYFSEIPSEVEPWRAALVMCGGVLFSVLGSLIPAAKAANMDPVRALRFE